MNKLNEFFYSRRNQQFFKRKQIRFAKVIVNEKAKKET